mmetsp:Transcript_13282/g.26533  ORF Transcript_13282/g.26533 Transcript_13282/m.26533 type:complete len:85 (+) Transcript_13282:295-549(+)
MSKFTGSITVDMSVDTAVMVIDNARSALKIEHHQFEYDPPGELVITSKVTPTALSKSKNNTTKKPSMGKSKNCKHIPSNMAFLF